MEDAAGLLESRDVITIESSDDECNIECHSLSGEKLGKLRTVQSVLPFLSDQSAQVLLESVGWDVERAIHQSLETNSDDATTTRNASPSAGRSQASAAPKEDGKKIFAYKSSPGADNNSAFCKEWHAIVSRCHGSPFCDPDFPPSATSIDGRLRRSGGGKSAILCRCGNTAIPKKCSLTDPIMDASISSVVGDRGRYAGILLSRNNNKTTRTNRASSFRIPTTKNRSITKIEEDQSLHQHCNVAISSSGTPQGQMEPLATGVAVNLFLDGAWQPIIVDSNLPVVIQKRGKKAKDESLRGGIHLTEDMVALPAFCSAPDYQLWAPLVEKAYAKAHGSYQMLSGGFIQEGLQDLTGAPTETIVFQSGSFDPDTFWARLLSFSEAGFLMGVATAKGGDGLVGSHAYSVLEVINLNDCFVGQQSKLTDFFGKKRQKIERTTVRLVRIRNPWGKREWSGEWSAGSEKWTQTLRARLGSKRTFAKGDGTFYMSYDDMLNRFHHMDVAMTREDWMNCFASGSLLSQRDPIHCSEFAYFLSVNSTTSAVLSLLQPKKRANTKSTSWYCDPCMVVCERNNGTLTRESVIVSGVRRENHTEIILRPDREYVCLPFSCICSTKEESYPFRLSVYSSAPVVMKRDRARGEIDTFVRVLHQGLLSRKCSLYPMGEMGKLVCVHGDSCLYFIALNGYTDAVVSVRIKLVLPTGLEAAMERADYDIPPLTAGICCMVASNGRRSTATELQFSYLVSISSVNEKTKGESPLATGICSPIPLTAAGELLTSQKNVGGPLAGGGTIETYHWIPQLGKAALS